MATTRQRSILKSNAIHGGGIPVDLSSKVALEHAADMPLPDFPLPSDDDSSTFSQDDSDSFQDLSSMPERRNSVGGEEEEPAVREPSRSTSWTDLDLSVVVALVAPIGNWLTGNDHLKNLFLVLLLIVYLHQLIQVPWELYHAARIRRPHPSFSTFTPSAEEDTSIKDQMRLAKTELRRHELAYLLITIVCPFVGAVLLRYVLSALSGVDSISWFSTTLFVLATGIRPWAHLIARLRERTTLLHDTVHYPSPDAQLIADSRLKVVLDRVAHLEAEFVQLKNVMAERARVEDMYDDINGTLDDVERALQKQEKRAENARVAHESRLAAVEKGISRALERRRQEKAHMVLTGAATPSSAFLRIFYGLWALLTLNFYFEPLQGGGGHRSLASKAPLHHMKSPNRLETILEDVKEVRGLGPSDSDSSSELADNEALPETDDVPEPVLGTGKHRHTGRRSPSRPRTFVDFTSDIVALPYRLAVDILVAISPPVQRLFS